MIEFFRDTLDGLLYYVVAVIAIILIMAIIGYIIEKKQAEKKEQENIAIVGEQVSVQSTPTVNNEPTIVPIAPVVETPIMETNPNSDRIDETPVQQEQVPTIIDFGSTKDDNTNNVI